MIQTEPERTVGARRAVTLAAAVSVLLVGGAVAHAQAGGTSGDVTGLALSSLRSAVAALQVQVAALQAADHVDRATISASGAVLSQNGRWLGRVEHPFAGNYLLSFAPGAFTAPPTCVVTALANESVSPSTVGGLVLAVVSFACTAATPSSMTCQGRSERGNGVDAGMSLICVGP